MPVNTSSAIWNMHEKEYKQDQLRVPWISTSYFEASWKSQIVFWVPLMCLTSVIPCLLNKQPVNRRHSIRSNFTPSCCLHWSSVRNIMCISKPWNVISKCSNTVHYRNIWSIDLHGHYESASLTSDYDFQSIWFIRDLPVSSRKNNTTRLNLSLISNLSLQYHWHRTIPSSSSWSTENEK